MEKQSRRRIRDLVIQPASQGLSENESGCARISMMARSTNAPFTGRIQKRKTNHLRPFTSGLQRTAGPYSWIISTPGAHCKRPPPLLLGFGAAICAGERILIPVSPQPAKQSLVTDFVDR